MKKLIEINTFGSIDADNDDILFSAFEEHKAFKDLANFEKFLVIGKKGSGKTAIFKKILTINSHNTFTYGHTFSDYPWHYHKKQKIIGIPDSDKYIHSWKYLILLTISKFILNHDQSIPFDDESCEQAEKIEKFIIDTYGTRDPDITQIFTPSKTLKLQSSFTINWGLLKGQAKPGYIPIEHLPVLIQDVNKNLTDIIFKTLNPKHKYYIVFDELDLGFNPNSEDYSSRLIGLILAARDLNNYAKSIKANLSVAIFLRNDIYNLLHFEDKNKITRNFATYIEWDSSKSDDTLKKLMERRFTLLLSNDSNKVSWEDVFDEDKRMTGKQPKYQHIIDRTFLRPRDMIQFCNEILSYHNLNNNDSSKFENEDINKSRESYSNYFLDELDDEVHKHIPNYISYFDIFKDIGSIQFLRSQFNKAYTLRKEQMNNEPPEDILKKLFEFSIIGYYSAGGSGYGGSEYVFRYKDERAFFDGNATKLKVHPGLTEVLQLKKYSITSA